MLKDGWDTHRDKDLFDFYVMTVGTLTTAYSTLFAKAEVDSSILKREDLFKNVSEASDVIGRLEEILAEMGVALSKKHS